jgi:hypothetical protein
MSSVREVPYCLLWSLLGESMKETINDLVTRLDARQRELNKKPYDSHEARLLRGAYFDDVKRLLKADQDQGIKYFLWVYDYVRRK